MNIKHQHNWQTALMEKGGGEREREREREREKRERERCRINAPVLALSWVQRIELGW